MITMKDVNVTYPGFQLDCSMVVKKGQIVGMVGENGAGKTTLFKVLLGLIPIKTGEITVQGNKHQTFLENEKDTLGVVLSDSFFNSLFTVEQIAKLLESLYAEFEIDYFWNICEQLNIPKGKPLKKFSTGMLAKIKIAAAMSHKASFLILDEPTSGLDVRSRYKILALLQLYMDRFPETSILISSHISDDLEHLCDEMYFLKEGAVLLHEETDILIDHYALIKGSEKQLEGLPLQFQLFKRKSNYGVEVLTNQKAFLEENFLDLVVEKVTIDQLLLMMSEGERL